MKWLNCFVIQYLKNQSLYYHSVIIFSVSKCRLQFKFKLIFQATDGDNNIYYVN